MNKKLSILLIVLAAGCEGTGGRFDPDVVDKRTGTAANPIVGEPSCRRWIEAQGERAGLANRSTPPAAT
jgi:hypothetical protein